MQQYIFNQPIHSGKMFHYSLKQANDLIKKNTDLTRVGV